MTITAKDILGALVVALVSMMLFVLLMGSIVLMGHGAGARPVVVDGASLTHVPALCYHSVRGGNGPLRVLKVLGYVVLSLPLLRDEDVWTVSAAEFDKQMRYLQEHGYESVSLDQVVRWREGRGELPPRPVVITFDDGDRSVYEVALPILQKYGFGATLFVVTARVGQDWEGVRGLGWKELRQMYDSGTFDIESHTHDLHYKVPVGQRHEPVFLAAARGRYRFDRYESWEMALLDDLGTSRALIRRHVGAESHYLAWPYGQGGDAVDRIAERSGFSHTVLLQGGVNHREEAAVSPPIERFAVTGRTSLRAFGRMLRDDPDPDEM